MEDLVDNQLVPRKNESSPPHTNLEGMVITEKK